MTNAPHPGLTKTCVNCGQTKPLSAFLEMSDSYGTVYGNVCSACRKTALEERRRKTEAEGSTTSETGHKIDSKTKVQDAKERRELLQETEEKYHKERDIKEELTQNQLDKKLQIQQQEKKHRSDFLQQKRPAIKPDKSSGNTAIHNEAAVRTQSNEVTTQNIQGSFEERKKTEHDFNVPYQGDQVAGRIRFSGPLFRQFCDLLGNSAPIVSNVNQTVKEVTPKKAGAITQSAHQIKDTEAASNKTNAEDFIEKNWRPGSKR